MPSRKKKLKPRFSTARNDRRTVYHYFPQSEEKSIAVQGGRCQQCKHITALHCEKCSQYYCDKHLPHNCDKRIEYAF